MVICTFPGYVSIFRPILRKSLVCTVRLKGPVACRDQHVYLHLSRRCQHLPAETAKKSRFYRQTQGSGSTQRPTWSSAPFPEMSASSGRDCKKVLFLRQTQGSGSMWRYLMVIRIFVSQRRTSPMISG